MLLSDGTLRIPNEDGTERSISIGDILNAEVRQTEVAIVTPHKAPELLMIFNEAWRNVHDLVTELTDEHNQAQKVADKRKAVILLEVVPKVLKEKELPTNADIRQAIINTDPAYEKASERADYIACVVEYLKGKLKSFENAYNSVKKIMSDDAFNMQSRPNPNLSGNSGNSPSGSTTPRRGFGTPKY